MGIEQTPPPRRRVKEMEEVKFRSHGGGVHLVRQRLCIHVPQSVISQGRRLHLTTWDPQIANAPPFPQWFKHEEIISRDTRPRYSVGDSVAQHDPHKHRLLCRLVSQSWYRCLDTGTRGQPAAPLLVVLSSEQRKTCTEDLLQVSPAESNLLSLTCQMLIAHLLPQLLTGLESGVAPDS